MNSIYLIINLLIRLIIIFLGVTIVPDVYFLILIEIVSLVLFFSIFINILAYNEIGS